MWNLHCRFVLCFNGQIYGGDFEKFCGLLRIYELYLSIYFITGSSADGSRKSSRVTFAPNLIHGKAPRKGSRKESSQSLQLTSVLSQAERRKMESRKTSSKSEGAAIESRKVSFIDELTGVSARPDPKFEQQLQLQLRIVKNNGEMGEFMQNQNNIPETPTILETTTTTTFNETDNTPIASDEEKEAKIRNLK